MSKFYVMEVNNILPPMASSAWLVPEESEIRWYKECGHQVVYLRSDIQYEREMLSRALDFNLTEEYINGYRERLVVVSAKVKKLLIQNKAYAGFFPVAIID
jgi:hypothetical protein